MNEEVQLIPVDETMERGNIRRTPHREMARVVYARAVSVGRREYYDSFKAGFDLALKLVVWEADYLGETLAVYGGEEYRVVRSYKKKKDHTVELTCEKLRGRE